MRSETARTTKRVAIVLRVTLYIKIMVTLTYSNVDGVERISDGLHTYERAPINIKPFSEVMRVATLDLDFLVKHRTVTCSVLYGHISERISDMWEIQGGFTCGKFYAFHKELFVRRCYTIVSEVANGEWSSFTVSRFSTYTKTWRPVSPTFKTFGEAKDWCDERCICLISNLL